MKKITALLLLTSMLLAGFAGCSKKDDVTTDTGDSSLSYVTEKNELIVGLDDSFPPMGFRDENNEIVGFDIDLAKEVAKKLNVELKLQPIEWKSKELELDTKTIDCIWNGLSINEERLNAMTMSQAYLDNEMVFVVRQDTTSINDIDGKNVAVQTGSTAEKSLEDELNNNTLGVTYNILGFDDNLSALLDLETKGVDAVFMDSVVANYLITKSGKDFKILDEKIAPEQYAIGFRKGDVALEQAVSGALAELYSEGVVQEISTKWFGDDITLIGK